MLPRHRSRHWIGPLIIKCRNLKKLGLAFSGYLHNLNLTEFLALPGKFSEYVQSHNAAAFEDPGVPVRNEGIIHSCLCRTKRSYYSFSNDVPAEHEAERCSRLAIITGLRNFREIYRGLNGSQQTQNNNKSAVERKENSMEVQAEKITVRIEEVDQHMSNQTVQDELKSTEGVSIDRKISPARKRFISCLSDPSLPSTRQLSSITHLNLRCCASLDDQSLDQIAFHCPDLRILDIGECSRITDASLYSIVRNSHVLKTLDMTRIPLCTKDGVLQLMQSLDLLEQIKLSSDSKSYIAKADVTELHGRKSAKGKYISIETFRSSWMYHDDGNHECIENQLTINIVSDAAYNRISTKRKESL